MTENIEKFKLNRKIIKKLVVIILAVSIMGSGTNFCSYAQFNDGNIPTRPIASIFSTDSSTNPTRRENRLTDQTPSQSEDEFSGCFNFFCFIPAVILTILRIIASSVQKFGPASSKDK